jgi:plastocyanin
MRRQRYLSICSAILFTLALSGCAVAASDSTDDAAPVATTEVSVRDNNFEPVAAEIVAGDTVTWTWEGEADHNVVGDTFESDVQREGTFEQRFDEPGTYDYACTLHSGMTGKVVVTQGASGDAEGQ